MPFDLSLPVLLLLAIGLATCGATASAQTMRISPDAVRAADATAPPASPAAPASLDPPAHAPRDEASGLRDEAVRERAPQTEATTDAQARALADAEALRLATPVVYATGYGLRVRLPGGWEGPVSAQEARFPAYALYTFDNARLDRAVPGARLRVERIGTLNPLEQERWRRGQSPYGLHGLRPVAPADAGMLPLPAQAAVAVEGDGLRGVTAYVQRGATWWAVQAAVPAGVYNADPAVLADLLGGLTLPGDGAGMPELP